MKKNKFAAARVKFFLVTGISGNNSIFLLGLRWIDISESTKPTRDSRSAPSAPTAPNQANEPETNNSRGNVSTAFKYSTARSRSIKKPEQSLSKSTRKRKEVVKIIASKTLRI